MKKVAASASVLACTAKIARNTAEQPFYLYRHAHLVDLGQGFFRQNRPWPARQLLELLHTSVPNLLLTKLHYCKIYSDLLL